VCYTPKRFGSDVHGMLVQRFRVTVDENVYE